MTNDGRCVFCKKFVYIQVDLDGKPAKDHLYICPKCQVDSGVVIICKEDNTKMTIDDDEAYKAFCSIPPRRVVLLDKKSRDAIIEELFTDEDKSYVGKLKSEICDDMEQISSFKSEISDLQIHIDKMKDELKSCYTHRLIRMG